MQNLGALFAQLAVIVVGVPLVVLAVYAWLFPMLRIVTPYGVWAGTLAAAGLGFYCINRTKGLTPAIIGAPVIAIVVFFLCMFLIANVLGE